ncbi:MAG: hypothetical protein OXB86_04020 [Bdellovibrionales bacterium]|nr:hypothetical protein [Bdellovibrionales bacterium]
MRFALVRLSAASVSNLNSFLTPILCYKGLCPLNKNRKNSNTLGIKLYSFCLNFRGLYRDKEKAHVLFI